MSRLFIALPVPDPIKQVIHQWSKTLEAEFPFQRWVYSADFHITLKFLGDTSADLVSRIQDFLHSISAETGPFLIHLTKLGYFGSRVQPAVLWAGIRPDGEALIRLQQSVESSMEEVGIARERRAYHPHLTLARKFRGNTPLDPHQLLASSQRLAVDSTSWEANRLVLFASHHGQTPMYEAVKSFPFLGR